MTVIGLYLLGIVRVKFYEAGMSVSALLEGTAILAIGLAVLMDASIIYALSRW